MRQQNPTILRKHDTNESIKNVRVSSNTLIKKSNSVMAVVMMMSEWVSEWLMVTGQLLVSVLLMSFDSI